jgi:YbgC/YbaW family acyl-CoA thioester hydrolase
MDAAAFHPVTVQERVRWADVDLVGIVRFSAVPRLVELAEQELWRAAGIPYAELFQDPAFWLPRRTLAVDYLSPARIDDLLQLEAWVARMGTKALTLAVAVRQAEGGRLVATAEMVLVCVTNPAFVSAPIPAHIRTALAPFVRPPAAPL